MRQTRGLVILIGLAVLAGAAVTRAATVGQAPCPELPCIVPLSQVPSAIVVDARTARAFITTLGGPAGAGQVQVFDTGSWRLLRTVAVGTGALTSAVNERTGRVFVAYENVRVRVLDARSGDLLRTVTIGRWPAIPFLPFAMALTVDESTGRAYVTSYTSPGHVSVLDARTGRVLRTFESAGFSGIAVNGRTGRLFLSNPYGTGVLVLDAAGGRVLRTTDVGGNPGEAVVDAQSGRVFVLTTNGHRVGMLDARTGTLKRIVRVGLYPQQATVDEPTGRVVVTAGDGSVSMLDARTGSLQHRTVLSTVGPGTSPGLLAVDGPSGRVLVATPGDASGDTVTVLNERSGAVLRTVPVGGVAVSIAVDQRIGHAFVIGEDTIVRAPDAWSWMPPWLRRRLPFVPPPGPHTRMLPGSVTVIDATR